MADKGRLMDTVFFIYDHNVLKKEEDDLKDAILFFSPSSYSIDERCALCGQLMGMSEFMSATICKSAPKVFRFEHDKYVFLHPGAYSLGLRGGAYTPDSVLQTQLSMLYETFVTYHGTIDSLKLRFKGTAGGFLQELDNIWKIILKASGIIEGPSLSHTFQALPYVQLPKTGSHLFLQASHLLQSSQRRPYVLAGTILYKNRVLCTQLPPGLTRHLTYLHNQVPHIVRKTDCDLPKGCRIITVFLTDDELGDVDPLDSLGRRHCKVTDFSIKRESEVVQRHPAHVNKPPKQISRRLTCPNFVIRQPESSVPQKALQSFIVNEKRKKIYQVEQDSLRIENSSWSVSKSPKMSLSHVPIVECRTGESHCESEEESNTLRTNESHFGEKFEQIEAPSDFGNEMSESESESSETLTASGASSMPKVNKSNSADKFNTTCASKTNEMLNESSDMQSDSQEVKPSKVESDTEKSNKTETNKESIEKHKGDMADTLQSNVSYGNTNKSCTDLPNSKESISEKDENSSKLASGHSDDEVQKLQDEIKISNSSEGASNVTGKDSELERTSLQPSISDIEESDDDSPEIEDSPKKLKGPKKGEKSYSASIEESVNIGASIEVGDSLNSNSSKMASNDLRVLENKMLSSISSEENTQVRFYDKMPNDKTETLKKDSNHAIYEHHVEIHVDSIGNSVTDDSSVSALGKNGINKIVNTDLTQKSEDTAKSQPKLVNNKSIDEHVTHMENKCKEPSADKAEVQNIQQGHNKLLPNVHKYESEVETEDESVTIGTVEPCINCLELAAKQSGDTQGQTIVRCSKCVANFKQKMMFGALGNDKEVIDFGEFGQDRHYESGAETDGGINVYNRKIPGEEKREGGSSVMSSLSSDVSTDSTISKYWTHEMDGLNDLTLYVQCHSDISLLLLMGNPDQYEENLFHSLWKGSLAYLADLDFYIKECTEMSDDDDDEIPSNGSYGYLKFDSFAAELKGTIGDPGSDKKSQNLHQMLTTLHSEFQHDQCLSDITLRSNFNSCYGHSTLVEETYFQPELQQKLSSGFPIPRDPVFNLDVVAKQYLAKDKHLSLI